MDSPPAQRNVRRRTSAQQAQAENQNHASPTNMIAAQANRSPPPIRRRRTRNGVEESQQAVPRDQVPQSYTRLADLIRFFLGIIQRTTRDGNIISPATGRRIRMSDANFMQVLNDAKFNFLSTTDPLEVSDRAYLFNLIVMVDGEVAMEMHGPTNQNATAYSPYARANIVQARASRGLNGMMYNSSITYAQRLMQMLYDGSIRIEPDSSMRSSSSSSRRGRYGRQSISQSVSPPPRVAVGESSIKPNDLSIKELCRTKFAALGKQNSAFQKHAALKAMVNKMKRLCDALLNSQSCDTTSLSNVIRDAKTRYHTKHNARLDMTGKVHDKEFENMFGTFEEDLEDIRIPFENWTIQYRNEPGIDAGGIRTSYCQAAADQIKHTGLLVETETGSGRYTFNPDPSLQIPYGDKHDVCKFLGAFIAFALIQKIPIDFHFSRFILLNLLYKPTEIDGDDLATIFLIEYPQEGQGLINMLVNPDSIAAVGLDFQDIDSSHPSKLVTAGNFRQYLAFHARSRMLSPETKEMLRHFKQGFYITYRFLRSRNVTVSQLDILLTSIEITNEDRHALAVNFMQSIATDIAFWKSHKTRDNRKKLRVVSWFQSIIKDGERTFPRDEVANAPHLPQTFRQFMPMLLFFWTGKKSYDRDIPYKITIHGHVQYAAHTCSNQLDIPYHFPNKNAMYRQLLRSIANPEFGFA